MALHRRLAESDHLPECFAATNKPWACPVCDALRACEQRVRRNYETYSNARKVGYASGVQAARDAVAALWQYEGVQTGPLMIGYHRALAAIDALRGES